MKTRASLLALTAIFRFAFSAEAQLSGTKTITRGDSFAPMTEFSGLRRFYR
jgi:hypothetical protein